MKIWKIEVSMYGFDTEIYLSDRKPTEEELDELKEKHKERIPFANKYKYPKIWVEEIEVNGITYFMHEEVCG